MIDPTLKPSAAEREERARVRATEGRKAMAEYLSEADRVAENTARLKALRLAREAEEAATVKPKKTKRAPAVRKAGRAAS